MATHHADGMVAAVAVPPAAAQAIAGVMGTTLLLAASGETFMLSSMPIWVRQISVALAVQQIILHHCLASGQMAIH